MSDRSVSMISSDNEALFKKSGPPTDTAYAVCYDHYGFTVALVTKNHGKAKDSAIEEILSGLSLMRKLKDKAIGIEVVWEKDEKVERIKYSGSIKDIRKSLKEDVKTRDIDSMIVDLTSGKIVYSVFILNDVRVEM